MFYSILEQKTKKFDLTFYLLLSFILYVLFGSENFSVTHEPY